MIQYVQNLESINGGGTSKRSKIGLLLFAEHVFFRFWTLFDDFLLFPCILLNSSTFTLELGAIDLGSLNTVHRPLKTFLQGAPPVDISN